MSADPQSKACWNEVLGKIMKSEVEFDWEYYTPVVEYTYEVNGITYRSDRIVAGLVQFNWKGPASRLVKRFPVGASVPVFVDPCNPRRATLQVGVDRNLPVFLVSFGLLLLVFLVLLARA